MENDDDDDDGGDDDHVGDDDDDDDDGDDDSNRDDDDDDDDDGGVGDVAAGDDGADVGCDVGHRDGDDKGAPDKPRKSAHCLQILRPISVGTISKSTKMNGNGPRMVARPREESPELPIQLKPRLQLALGQLGPPKTRSGRD